MGPSGRRRRTKRGSGQQGALAERPQPAGPLVEANGSLPRIKELDERVDEALRGPGKPEDACLFIPGLKGHLTGVAAIRIEVVQRKKVGVDSRKKIGGSAR